MGSKTPDLPKFSLGDLQKSRMDPERKQMTPQTSKTNLGSQISPKIARISQTLPPQLENDVNLRCQFLPQRCCDHRSSKYQHAHLCCNGRGRRIVAWVGKKNYQQWKHKSTKQITNGTTQLKTKQQCTSQQTNEQTITQTSTMARRNARSG